MFCQHCQHLCSETENCGVDTCTNRHMRTHFHCEHQCNCAFGGCIPEGATLTEKIHAWAMPQDDARPDPGLILGKKGRRALRLLADQGGVLVHFQQVPNLDRHVVLNQSRILTRLKLIVDHPDLEDGERTFSITDAGRLELQLHDDQE